MNTFQVAVLGIFAFLLIIGVLVFAGILPGFRSPPGGAGGTVIWWGTVPEDKVASLLAEFGRERRSDFTLEYVVKDPRTLERDLIEALASGQSPDLVTLPDTLVVKHQNKLLPLPYESFSQRRFLDTFARQGELFLAPEGVLGLPFSADPLVLYYNTDLVVSARLAAPPPTWTALQNSIKALNKIDARGNFLQSAIALGQWQNITHAKELLTLLILQAGNPIVTVAENGQRQVVLKELLGYSKPPAGEAVAFFNRFADPANLLYSWNSSLPEARDVFASGNLALYLGFASELPTIRRQNPQLDFDVALAPQREGAPAATVGRLEALVVPRGAKNPQTAFLAAFYLTDGSFARRWSEVEGLPPARKDLLGVEPADPFMALFYRAAIISRGFADPEPAQTALIWRNLAESVQVGRTELNNALSQAHFALVNLFNRL